MNYSLCLRGWILGLTMWLAGCATLSPAPRVGLTVVQINPRESTLLETGVELTLRLTNESAQPLTFTGSAHKLYVNESYVGRAVSAERTAVPAFGTSTPKITVYLENLVLLRKASEFSQATKLVYRLESRFHAAEGAGSGEVVATATGELDLAGLGLPPPLPAR